MNTGLPNAFLESWPKKSEFQIYQLKSSKMFSHHTKFEEMVFKLFGIEIFPG